MAKQVGKPFKKGVSGNPGGRPAVSPELKALRKLSQEELVEIAEVVLLGKTDQVAALALSADTHLKSHIAKAIHSEYRKGGFSVLQAVLDRILGKAKERHELSGEGGKPIQVEAVKATLEERAALLKGSK